MTTKTLPTEEVRRTFAEVLDFVRMGGTVVVQRYGKEVARIVPVTPATVPDPAVIVDRLISMIHDIAQPKLGDRWGSLTPEQWGMVPVGTVVDWPSGEEDGGWRKFDADAWRSITVAGGEEPHIGPAVAGGIAGDRIITHLPETK